MISPTVSKTPTRTSSNRSGTVVTAKSIGLLFLLGGLVVVFGGCTNGYYQPGYSRAYYAPDYGSYYGDYGYTGADYSDLGEGEIIVGGVRHGGHYGHHHFGHETGGGAPGGGASHGGGGASHGGGGGSHGGGGGHR